jgi:hypothetical protein
MKFPRIYPLVLLLKVGYRQDTALGNEEGMALLSALVECVTEESIEAFGLNFEYRIWSTGGMKLTGENRSTRGKNLSKRHFVHHKSHTGTDQGLELVTPR